MNISIDAFTRSGQKDGEESWISMRPSGRQPNLRPYRVLRRTDARQRAYGAHWQNFPALPGRQCRLEALNRQQAFSEVDKRNKDTASSHLQARQTSHEQASCSGRAEAYEVAQLINTRPAPVRSRHNREWQLLFAGAGLALACHVAIQWMSHLPVWQRLIRRFIWWKDGVSQESNLTVLPTAESTALTLYNENAESVEWFNMCWRKMWRVYQRGLERWLADLLQPVFDNLVAEMAVPRFVQRLRILEFTLNHEAPTFSNMRRRSSRKDSDLNGVVNVRYTGGARMLLLIEVGQGRWRFKLPVLVSDLDLECKLWIKLRLAPMAPYIGTIALAFVGPPNIKVQLLPYNHVRLMRIPILQPFLAKLLTVDLPGLMVLPKRLEINIPPAVTAVAEAAVGHDAVMRAVASAVLQADALEHALIAALPLGPQSAAGGISLPDSFHGELQVTLLEGRNLPVWGFPWQSNPYCRLFLGSQAVRSRRDDDTSHAGSHRAPVWNQEFQFLVEDPMSQVLEVHVRDSHLTGRADLGYIKLPLRSIPPDGHIASWVPVQSWTPGLRAEGDLHLKLTYKPFEDDETDAGYREAEAYALMLQEQAITDIKSAADASSRAAVAASAAAAAVAVTKAAAARAAAKAALSAKARARQKRLRAEAEKQERSSKQLERRLGKKERLAVLASREPQLPEDGGSRSAENDEEVTKMAEGQQSSAKAALDPLALQDISPEDLFPPVSFSINERADEDMPYSEPPKSTDADTEANETKKPQSVKEKIKQITSGASAARRQNGAGVPGTPRTHGGSDADDRTLESSRRGPNSEDRSSVARNGAAHVEESPARSSVEARGTSTGPDSEQSDLPLVLSTLENANLQEALSLDSNLSEVIEAVASGDIKAFTKDSFVKLSQERGTRTSVGRGPIKGEEEPPSEVNAAVEVTGDNPPTAEEEARKEHEAAAQGKSAVDLKQAPGAAAASSATSQKQDWLKSWLQRLPFIGHLEHDASSGEDSQEKEDQGRKEAQARSEDDDTIRDVVMADNVRLEAIAEEVQNSWRLKEIRAEQLMQSAAVRSERPWLVLLSSLFTATVVLLLLVLYRLYDLDKGTLGFVSYLLGFPSMSTLL